MGGFHIAASFPSWHGPGIETEMKTQGLLTSVGLAAALVGAMTLVGWGIEAASTPARGLWVDHSVADWAATDAPAFLGSIMKVVTWAGASAVVLPTLLLLSLALRDRARAGRISAFLVLSATGLLLSNVVKGTVERPRPSLAPLVAAGGSSFPSGHATAGAILFGSLAVVLVCYVSHRARPLVWLGAGLGAGAVAVSRVVLGVHWTTDVIGGLVLGFGWVWIAKRVTARYASGRVSTSD